MHPINFCQWISYQIILIKNDHLIIDVLLERIKQNAIFYIIAVATFERLYCFVIMTSSNGNVFRDTGPLCGEVIGLQWIPLTKDNDAEL